MDVCRAPTQVFGCKWRSNLAADRTRSVDVFEDPAGNQYAVKTLDLRVLLEDGEMKRLAYVKTEVLNHHELLQHPHVIQFLDATFEFPLLFIKMELARIDMLKFVSKYGPLREPAAQWLFLQLLHAVDYCHRRQVTNRDVKPNNLLLAYASGVSPAIKLCDFGLSKRCNGPMVSTVGTLACLAPEVLQQTNGAEPYSRKVDVWGCGVVLYFMLFNKLPFGSALDATSAIIVKQRILAIDWAIPPGAQLEPDCVDILHRMLAPSSTRWNVDQLWEHPWVKKHLPQDVVRYNEHLAERVPDPANVAKLEALLDGALQEVLQRAGDSSGAGERASQYDAIIYDELLKEQRRLRPVHPHGCC